MTSLTAITDLSIPMASSQTQPEGNHFSPEMARIPANQQGVIQGEAVLRTEEIFLLPFGFSLEDFLIGVENAIESVGGWVDGNYLKGGVVDHILDGADRPTSDLDLSIKLNEEMGAVFYERATWLRLQELLLELLEKQKIEKGQLKNCYLHFDDAKGEYHLLISFPVKGPLKSIDLQIVFKQKISCLTSYDSIQVDIRPLLFIRGKGAHQHLLAKTVGPYLFEKVIEQRQAGYFEVLPSSRIVRKGFLDLARKLLRGIKPISLKILMGYWIGFLEQYFREQGNFGAFDDDLRRYLIDHYEDEPLKAVSYLLNLDALICHFCKEEKKRDALRAILSTYAHSVLKQKAPQEMEALLFSLQEVEMNWMSLSRVREASFLENFIVDRDFSPHLFEVALPSKRRCFLYHSFSAEGERPLSRAPQTTLGKYFLPLLFPTFFHASSTDEKLVLSRREGSTFKEFFAQYSPESILKLSTSEQEEAAEHLVVLHHMDREGFGWLKPHDLALLKLLYGAFIHHLCEKNRSFTCRKIAAKLIRLLARHIDNTTAFPLAKELIVRCVEQKEEERLFAVQFYNSFFITNPNLAIALEMASLLFSKTFSLKREKEEIDVVSKLMEPFLNSHQFKSFFFEKAKEILSLPSPLFLKFLCSLLSRVKKTSEKEEEILFFCLDRLGKEKMKKEEKKALRIVLERFFLHVGEDRVKLKEKLNCLLGKKKNGKERVVASTPSPKTKSNESKSFTEFLAECRERLSSLDLSEGSSFGKCSEIVQEINKRVPYLVLVSAVTLNPSEIESIFNEIEKWYLDEITRIRGLLACKKSSQVDKWLNHLMGLHQKFFLSAVTYLSDKQKQKMLYVEHIQKLMEAMGRREIPPFSALERWVHFLNGFFSSTAFDLSLLRRLFLTYQESFRRSYLSESFVEEGLLFLEDQVLTHMTTHYSQKICSSDHLQEINFYLDRIIRRVHAFNPLFIEEYFNYGLNVFLTACDAEPVQNAALETLMILLGKSNEEGSHSWLSHMKDERRAWFYNLGLELAVIKNSLEEFHSSSSSTQEPSQAASPSNKALEMLDRMATSFPSVTTIQTKTKEKEKEITPQILSSMIKVADNLLRQGKAIDALHLVQRLIGTGKYQARLQVLMACCFEKSEINFFALNTFLKAYGFSLKIEDEDEKQSCLALCSKAIATLAYRLGELKLGDNYFSAFQEAIKHSKKIDCVLIGELFSERGKLLAKLGFWQEACECYKNAVKMCPENKELIVEYAEALFRSGQREEAKFYYLKAIGNNIGGEVPYMGLAALCLRNKNLNGALENYRLAEKKMKMGKNASPKNIFLLSSSIITILLMKKEFAHALHEMKRLAEGGLFQVVGMWENVWRAKIDCGKLEKALSARIERNRTDIEAFLLLQIYYRLQKEWAKAIEMTETILATSLKTGRNELISTLPILYENFLSSEPFRDDVLEKFIQHYRENGTGADNLYAVLLQRETLRPFILKECEQFATLFLQKYEMEKALYFFEIQDRCLMEVQRDPKSLAQHAISLLMFKEYEKLISLLFRHLSYQKTPHEWVLEVTYLVCLKMKKLGEMVDVLSLVKVKNPESPLIPYYSSLAEEGIGHEEELMEAEFAGRFGRLADRVIFSL